MPAKPSIRDFIEANSIPEPNSGCWLWVRGTTKKGYGVVRRNGRNINATHLAIDVPAGLFALHRCDTPICVNPDHLFVGTPKDNTQDALAKGRLVVYPKKDLCKHGHPLSGSNIYIYQNGYRVCKSCIRERKRKRDGKA